MFFLLIGIMLSENKIKEELSIAYVHTIAVNRGYTMDDPVRVDNDSIDVKIRHDGKISNDVNIKVASPELNLQLKCTTDWTIVNNEISFVLKRKNYDDLTAKCLVPKILVVLCLPPQREQWVNHSVNELLLRKCAYWLSLKEFPPTENGTSVTVRIPTSNIFSSDQLHDILTKISKQEW